MACLVQCFTETNYVTFLWSMTQMFSCTERAQVPSRTDQEIEAKVDCLSANWYE